MLKALAGVRVLIVEDDPDSGELLELALEGVGAGTTLAATGAAAMTRLALRPPDIILCDLELPDGNGCAWLEKFRALPQVAHVPAIALSGRARDSDRALSIAAGFAKHLCKPASLADIVTAISALAATSPRSGLATMLGTISTATGCRYTSLLRFESDKLISVWTYDRENPASDAFPLELPIATSYCQLVKDTRSFIAIEDAACDPRAEGHPKQHEISTYVAAPVFRANGEMFGTLCSYDPAPRRVDVDAREAIQTAARWVETSIVPAYAASV